MKKYFWRLWYFVCDVWWAFFGVRSLPGEAPREEDLPNYKKIDEVIGKKETGMMYMAYCTRCKPDTLGRINFYPKVKVGTRCPVCGYPLSTRGKHKAKENKYQPGVNC